MLEIIGFNMGQDFYIWQKTSLSGNKVGSENTKFFSSRKLEFFTKAVSIDYDDSFSNILATANGHFMGISQAY